ncbi:hypothetical protein C8R47DRAFT_1192246, partial [Mycena vitilis]
MSASVHAHPGWDPILALVSHHLHLPRFPSEDDSGIRRCHQAVSAPRSHGHVVFPSSSTTTTVQPAGQPSLVPAFLGCLSTGCESRSWGFQNRVARYVAVFILDPLLIVVQILCYLIRSLFRSIHQFYSRNSLVVSFPLHFLVSLQLQEYSCSARLQFYFVCIPGPLSQICTGATPLCFEYFLFIYAPFPSKVKTRPQDSVSASIVASLTLLPLLSPQSLCSTLTLCGISMSSCL